MNSPSTVIYGADPEFFITTKEGEVVESSEVIPINNPDIARDGVQVEIHPAPSYCRQVFGDHIMTCMIELKHHLDRKNLSLLGDARVEIPQERLDSFTEAAQQLGCAPSLNIHNANASVEVKGSYTSRSAGGHIHLSQRNLYRSEPHQIFPIQVPKAQPHYVRALDYLLGTLSVMVDPDDGQAERRKVYGRAGEYRSKPYGIEYRVLSNFWLRSYPIMSLILQAAKRSIEMVDMPAILKDCEAAVPVDRIVTAINEGDRDLARKNWNTLMSVASLRMHLVGPDSDKQDRIPGLFPGFEGFKDFDYFLTKPITEWFPQDPLTYWTTTVVAPHRTSLSYSRLESQRLFQRDPVAYRLYLGKHYHTTPYYGWETFLRYTVRSERTGAKLPL